jgi:hypothetical protein
MSDPQSDWKPGQPPPWDQPQQPPPAQQPQGQWAPGQQPPPNVPWTPQPQQAPPKKRSNVIQWVVILVVGAVIVGGIILFRDRLTGNPSDLRAGDCFDEPTATQNISEVQHHPCNEAHTAEAFAVLTDATAGGAAYPGTEYFRTQMVSRCTPAATAYYGRDIHQQTELDFGMFFPNNDGWGDNDREMTCYFYRVDGGTMTASVRNAGGGGASSSP